jgi:hypothetical protein
LVIILLRFEKRDNCVCQQLEIVTGVVQRTQRHF